MMYLLVLFISIVSSFKEFRYLMKLEQNKDPNIERKNTYDKINAVKIILQ